MSKSKAYIIRYENKKKESKLNIELFYSKASANYIIINHTLKTYVLMEVKYKDKTAVEKVLGMNISKTYSNMKDFKKDYRKYK